MKSLHLPGWGAFLRYEDLPGENPASVYVAGLIWASQAGFVPIVAQQPALASLRSLFVDLLGTGFSDAPEEFGYSLEDHAATVAQLLDERKLRGCSLVGYSIGGAVAITLAAIRPDLVSRLVLLEANLDPLGPGEGMVSTAIAAQSEAEFCAGGFQDLVESFRQAGEAGDGTAATTAGILQVAAPHAVHRSAVALVAGTRPTMRQRLLQMKLPRTYIFGERSLPDPDWDALAGQGIQVLAVPDAGHGMAWDNPGGVAQALVKAMRPRTKDIH